MKGEVAKIAGLLMLSIACFYVGRRWATSYDQVLIVSTAAKGSNSNVETASSRTPFVALVPDPIRTHDLAALNITVPAPPPLKITVPAPPPAPLASPPPGRFGIVDANGAMQTDFRVGDEDDGDDVAVEVQVADVDLGNGTFGLGVGGPGLGFEGGDFTNLKRFGVCDGKMSEYVPCLDNLVAIRRLKSTERGERFERHCPSGAARLQCRVPTPPKYRTPIPWPRSRDQVWYSNVPHTKLVEDKGGQNWIQLRKNKFVFPGGGTQFIHGADHYIDQMAQMVHDLAFGVHTRVVLDVGCGVASFGAFLLSRNVLTLSIAPKDVHENQIQFALERGVPAMVAAFATRRLLYPSQAFNLIHCSRCRINWTRDGGILLLEVDRMLRAGGYFAWAAQPVYKHETNLQEAWKDMEDLATRLCWKLVNKEGYIAIWQKPFDNTCYVSRDAGVQPPLCDANDDPDDVWYVPLKACITQLPENGFGRNLTKWPERLHISPDRLEVAPVDAYVAKKELFVAEQNYNRFLVESYWHGLGWKRQHFRNVMDMRAGFGGFATALVDLRVDCWVMNVVPVSGPNTLPVIYDRGLIGVVHDWCEPFDTYPRTYDLLYASGLYSIEEKRCNITDILLEMDRIMRPGAHAYIRDTRAVIAKIEVVAKAIGWTTRTFDTEEGPYASRKILGCEKMLSHS